MEQLTRTSDSKDRPVAVSNKFYLILINKTWFNCQTTNIVNYSLNFYNIPRQLKMREALKVGLDV